MRATIPIYVRQHKPENSPAPLFHAQPLFAAKPWRSGTVLSRVLNKLSNELRKTLDAIGRSARQRELADWTFNPVVERQFLKLLLTLRRRTVNAHVLAVAFKSGDARLGFFPELPKVWFDVPTGVSLESRSRDVLTEFFLKLEKEEQEKFDPETMLGGNVRSAMLTSVDVDVDIRPELPKPEERPMFFLGATEAADGTSELFEVGRLLDVLYPDDLDQAVLREADVAELSRRLTDPDKRPVLLLGPRGVGKTAIVHESVRRRLTSAKTAEDRNKHAVWLLSPQRLISGMSYVGQWEDRLLAILKAAAKRDDVLYFDDVLGLYFAGQHARSSLSVADVMRPAIERREFRMLAEMTPEAFRILRERDRAMADLFDILPLREPSEDQTRRILVTVQRQLEDRHRCRFELDAMPTVLDLQRRYVRDVVMPGKAADLLRRLAGGHAKQLIARAQALEAFQSYSGLSTEFLDTSARLKRQEVIEALSRRVVSQPAAVEAMADAVCVAKARLNDPGRPVATFLFLGPTGVGKTECAKALAGYLFGQTKDAARGFANQASSQLTSDKKSDGTAISDNDRLLRFDMNEYVDPGAVARLIGTPVDPEGLLTSAVRRQPFGVVLLDEIEKAHPAVFDLLLAVLGEGRLTDARGRLADFTNTIIVMTSNLGVREAGSSFGLRSDGVSDSGAHAVYRDAAQRFFRPEFFNRIDRVIPFDRLDREDVANIARRLMDSLLTRDGLTGRRCMLRVEPEALARIVNSGYHPQLGARALKREVEKRIATPVARKLATMPPGEPTVIDVLLARQADGSRGSAALVGETASGGGGGGSSAAELTIRVTPIRPAEPIPDTRPMISHRRWHDAQTRVDFLDDLLDRVEAALDRLESQAESLAPAGGMTQGKMSAGHFAYLAIREQAKSVNAIIERLDRAVEASTRPPSKNMRKGGRSPQQPGPARPLLRRVPDVLATWRDLLAGHGLPEVPVVPESDEHLPRLRELTSDLLDELALLNAMVSGTTADIGADADEPVSLQPAGQRWLLLLRSQSDNAPLDALAQAYRGAFMRQHGVSVELVPSSSPGNAAATLPRTVRAVLIDMPGGPSILGGEQGTHLFISASGAAGLLPVEARLVAIEDGADPSLAAHGAVSSTEKIDRQPAGVVRVYGVPTMALDLRTALACEGPYGGSVLRALILRTLPLPHEVSRIR